MTETTEITPELIASTVSIVENQVREEAVIKKSIIDVSENFIDSFLRQNGFTSRRSLKKTFEIKFKEPVSIETEDYMSEITGVFVYKNHDGNPTVSYVDSDGYDSYIPMHYLNSETILSVLKGIQNLKK